MGISGPAILNHFRYFWNSNRGLPQELTIMNTAYLWRLNHLALGVYIPAGCPWLPSDERDPNSRLLASQDAVHAIAKALLEMYCCDFQLLSLE